MKTLQGGYKAMIRDRCPKTVDLALKWCNSKTKWVNYVYDTFVWWIKSKDVKDQQVRNLLGISKTHRGFNFDHTIDWNELSPTEYKYWKNTSEWVHWFEKSILPIAESYKGFIQIGDSSEEIKAKIKKKHFGTISESWQEKLYNHIIPYITEYYV